MPRRLHRGKGSIASTRIRTKPCTNNKAWAAMRALQSSAAMKWREVVEVQTAPATAGYSLKFKSCRKKINEGQATTAPLESIQYGLIKHKGRCFTCLHLFQNTVSQGMLHYMFVTVCAYDNGAARNHSRALSAGETIPREGASAGLYSLGT